MTFVKLFVNFTYYDIRGVFMIISSFILSISTSIDSFGIGLTYGLKKTVIQSSSKIILLGISFLVAFLSVFMGKFIDNFLNPFLANFIGSSILIVIGIIILLKTFCTSNLSDNTYYDFNHSKAIEPFEAFILGLGLSIDSFGIGISYGLLNWNIFLFPILVVLFQYLFLTLGIYIGLKISRSKALPNRFWEGISGILLLIIGIVRLFV